jgi:hypothetical protein
VSIVRNGALPSSMLRGFEPDLFEMWLRPQPVIVW